MPKNLTLDFYSLVTRLEDKREQIVRPYVEVTNFDTKEVQGTHLFKHTIEGGASGILTEVVDALALVLAAAEHSDLNDSDVDENKIVERTKELKTILKDRL